MNRLQAAEQMRRALQMFAASLSEDDALIIANVYPDWDGNNRPYKTGAWVKYGEDAMGDARLYQVLQDHTSQSQWTPDAATSLYKRVGVSADGTPKWVQPVGATDAYNKGDVVEHNGAKWVSDIDANVWEPGVYGWTKQGNQQPTEPETPTDNIKDFVQPSGAHDTYAKGDKVRFNGKVYESVIDNNAYSPSAYPAGWKEITE